MIELKTKRLIISDHDYSDVENMHRLLSDPKAMYYLNDIKTNTLEETYENLITAIRESKSSKRKKYYFKIQLKDNYEYIGEIGYTVKLDTPDGKVVSLGYFILSEFWGKGIVTEAAKEVIRFGFENNGVIKVETGCIKDNIASEMVMKKVGMIKEAEFKKKRYGMIIV